MTITKLWSIRCTISAPSSSQVVYTPRPTHNFLNTINIIHRWRHRFGLLVQIPLKCTEMFRYFCHEQDILFVSLPCLIVRQGCPRHCPTSPQSIKWAIVMRGMRLMGISSAHLSSRERATLSNFDDTFSIWGRTPTGDDPHSTAGDGIPLYGLNRNGTSYSWNSSFTIAYVVKVIIIITW